MRKVIVILLSVLFCCTSVFAANPNLQILNVSSIQVNQADPGVYTISIAGNPAILSNYNAPVLCGVQVQFLNRTIPFCAYPIIFLDKNTGRALISEQDPTLRINYAFELDLVDTPAGLFYCVYKNEESSTCELYPKNLSVKIGDQFWACLGPHINSISSDGKGSPLLVDCDITGATRFGKLIVVGISSDGAPLLKFTAWYMASIAMENDHPYRFMMSYGYEHTYILKKILPPPAKEKTKKVSSRSHKK